MFTKLQIINLGLGKIGQSTVSRIDPPVSNLEKFVAAGYPHWKRTELTKRAWLFAIDEYVTLTIAGTLDNVDRPYKYALPVECLRPVRRKGSDWVKRGQYVYSAYSALTLPLIMNVDEEDFDPLFVEVLASRVAFECVEYVTQSNTKKEETKGLHYDVAVADAAKANAFTRESETPFADDTEFEYLFSRW